MKQKKLTQLPEFLRPYFWDVAFEKIDLEKNPQFILKRVLDRGNTKALLWALSIFDTDDVRQLIMITRDISRKTANFWAEILDIPKDKVPCLQKPYSPIHFGLSS